ncbi:hypothetical protein AOQ84DRAFT_210783 [Glonium stellatum]|uniref:Uncharacterized protein n=1 Tax=Glonium stellatum TaxID=574774 RepID=A0A8E2F511_9PEZI|nr:hypothetical protein AOQ84DRAFT_210783 [Glonium stellatum]
MQLLVQRGLAAWQTLFFMVDKPGASLSSAQVGAVMPGHTSLSASSSALSHIQPNSSTNANSLYSLFSPTAPLRACIGICQPLLSLQSRVKSHVSASLSRFSPFCRILVPTPLYFDLLILSDRYRPSIPPDASHHSSFRFLVTARIFDAIHRPLPSSITWPPYLGYHRCLDFQSIQPMVYTRLFHQLL